MFYTTQQTIYLSDLELATKLGLNYEVHANTTLNEKLNHLTKETPLSTTAYPTIKYWCIGVGGNGTLVDPNAYPYSPHMPWDAALFNMIPFVMRTKDKDLDYSEKLKYRLRVERMVNGVNYICYYLKIFGTGDIEYKNEYSQISRRGDLNTIDPLNLDEKDPLNPKPVTKIDKIIGTNTSYIIKKAKLTFTLTLAELEEIRNNIDLLILDQTARTYKITEIGVCFGKDKIVNNITEALQAQIGYHIGPDIDLQLYLNSKTALSRSYEFGMMEPLYAQ